MKRSKSSAKGVPARDQPDARQLAVGLRVLQELPQLPPRAAERRWRRFQQEQGGTSPRLVRLRDSPLQSQPTHLLLWESPAGAVTLAYAPDTPLPWVVQQAEDAAENVIVTVGDQPITFQSALHWLRLTARLEGLIEEMITAAVLRQCATEHGISVSTREIAAAQSGLRKLLGEHHGSRWRSWLARHHLGGATLAECVERVLLARKLRDVVTSSPSDEEVRRYRRGAERVLLGQVVFATRQAADRLRRGLPGICNSGEWVRAMASAPSRRSSPDGQVAWRRRADLSASIADAVLSARIGAVIGPVPDAGEFHVLVVLAVRRAPPSAELIEDLLDQKFTAWLHDQRSRFPVRWYWMPSEDLLRSGDRPDREVRFERATGSIPTPRSRRNPARANQSP